MSSEPEVDRDDTILLEVHYKSGKTIRFRAKDFSGKITPEGTLRSLSWEAVGIKPAFIGINEIESIWRIE
jgi:hypothetical protein